MPGSPFLLLPPELRLTIYEALSPPTADPTPIALNSLDLYIPSNTLLLTCKKVYREVRPIYRHHYRTFWKSSNFNLSLDAPLVCSHNLDYAEELFAQENLVTLL
jgi:hypothetical protein